MRIRIAGVDLLFAPDGPDLHLLDDYAGEFRVPDDEPGAPDIRVSLAMSADLPVPHAVGEFQVERSGSSIAFVRHDLVGTWEPSGRSATVRCWSERTSIGSLLRVMCGLFLPRSDGLLLHASSVVSGGRAFVFPGKSGAGKTSLARLGGDRTVLCDEISAVRRVGADFIAMPTPFFGEMERRPRGEPAKLALLGIPVKSGRSAIVPVSKARVLADVLHCAVAFDESVEGRSDVLRVASSLVSDVPSCAVEFSLSDDPWILLDAFEPARTPA
jgi:hypothetical protein